MPGLPLCAFSSCCFSLVLSRSGSRQVGFCRHNLQVGTGRFGGRSGFSSQWRMLTEGDWKGLALAKVVLSGVWRLQPAVLWGGAVSASSCSFSSFDAPTPVLSCQRVRLPSGYPGNCGEGGRVRISSWGV